MGSRAALGTAHHPQTDGQSECTIQELLRLIQSYANRQQDQWEELLPLLEISINSSVNSTTGFAPNQLFLGRKPRLPLDASFEEEDQSKVSLMKGGERGKTEFTLESWLHRLQQELELARQQACVRQQRTHKYMCERLDPRRNKRGFQKGDWVLLSMESHELLARGARKQREKFQRLYVVEKRIHPNAYRLRGLLPDVPKTQNVQFLKPFFPSPAKFDTRPSPEFASPVMIEGTGGMGG